MGEAKRRAAAGWLPAWTPFERASSDGLDPTARAAFVRELIARGMGLDDAMAAVDQQDAILRTQEHYRNSRYQVSIDRNPWHRFPESVGPIVWLSIKRLDRGPVGIERFRDFQRIKNELVGPECEAIELYPAESRLVDTSNQYHLWAFTEPATRVPLGYQEREVITTAHPGGGARQQPYEEER